MTPAEELFEQIAVAMTRLPGVGRNRRGSLTVGDRVRAMTSRGHIVVRLPTARVGSLVAAGVGEHYKGQANDWLQVADGTGPAVVRDIVLEALQS